MTKLLIHSSQTAIWHALVNEAQSHCSIHLNVELESYLVFLLMRFCDRPDMVASVLGLEFLESAQAINAKPYLLKEVGDKCLLFAGLFPGRAVKRRVAPDYFVKLGTTAYLTLSDTLATNDSDLFATLGGGFVPMIDVLHATRNVANKSQEYTLINPLLNSLDSSH